jgi:predicted transcriptional regulator
MPTKKNTLPERQGRRLRITVDLDKETARRLEELLQVLSKESTRCSISYAIRRAISEWWRVRC